MFKYISKRNEQRYELDTIADMMVAAEEWGGVIHWKASDGSFWKIEKIKPVLEKKTDA